jgi:predicted O-methyltransferase YrrM
MRGKRFFPAPGDRIMMSAVDDGSATVYIPCMRNLILLCIAVSLLPYCAGPDAAPSSEIDAKVKAFLNQEQGRWRDMNVPYQDGQVLYDLIVKNNYRNVLEIGTSTGLSAVWIAWALSKTGGKLTTIEIDRRRHGIAEANFKKTGLTPYIDAVHGNAHKLVYELEGPYDLVFTDADKGWYIKYFDALHPKLKSGGTFAAHNVLNTGMRGIPEFVEYVKGRDDYVTTIDRSSRAGISLSRKK